MKFNPDAKLDPSQVKYKLPSGKVVTRADFLAFLSMQMKKKRKAVNAKEAV